MMNDEDYAKQVLFDLERARIRVIADAFRRVIDNAWAEAERPLSFFCTSHPPAKHFHGCPDCIAENAVRERTEARARVIKLHDLIKRLEWTGGSRNIGNTAALSPTCISCGAFEGDGHEADCIVGCALG